MEREKQKAPAEVRELRDAGADDDTIAQTVRRSMSLSDFLPPPFLRPFASS